MSAQFLFMMFLIFPVVWVIGHALLVWHGERTWLQDIRKVIAVPLLIIAVYGAMWLWGVT